MRLLNIKNLPPGGFPYTQPDTGMKFLGMVGFSDQVAAITAHRRRNKLARSNPSEVSQDLHEYTCSRLGNNPDFCSDGVVQIKKKNTLERLGEAARHVAETVSSTASGVAILSEWLGHGAQPVSQELAQARSDICTGRINGNPCEKNQQKGWSVAMQVAQAIETQMVKKKELGIKVEGEAELGTCSACGCFLKLKNWVPFEHIYAHTSDEQFQKFPAMCWIVRESQNKNPA